MRSLRIFAALVFLVVSAFGQGTSNGNNFGGGNLKLNQTPLTTEGDLLTVSSGTALIRLALGTNGQCLTSNGTDAVWGGCTGTPTFPLLGSAGSLAAPTYSFSGDTTTGCLDIANSMTCKSSNGIWQLSGSVADAGAGEMELYITPDNTTTKDAVIQFNGVNTKHYRILVAGSGADAGNFIIRDKGQGDKFLLTDAANNIVFPNTSSTIPVQIVNNGTIGTDSSSFWIGPTGAGETINHETYTDALRISSSKTGANGGNLNINNTCEFDNTANNSGRFAFGCSVPNNNATAGAIGIYTNDGAPFAGNGALVMNPNDGAGFSAIEMDNDVGTRLNFQTHNQGTLLGRIQTRPAANGGMQISALGALQLGSGTVGSGFQWNINTSGHFIAVTDNTNDIGASGATRPRNLFIGTNGTFGGIVSIGSGSLWTESAAPTNVSASLYPDSTEHEWKSSMNGGNIAGMMLRSEPSPVSITAQTSSKTTSTACGATAGFCSRPGTYTLHFTFWEDGTACGTPGTGGVTLQLTWTDRNGTVHSAITVPLDDSGAGTPTLGTKFTFQSALATAWASGDFTLSSNGSIIQYATTYSACGVGTGSYGLDIYTTRGE